MISICIPIYNCDSRQLVQDLGILIKQEEIPAEIIVIDDASTSYYKAINKSISLLPYTTYKELSSNVGRSRIRNMLAFNASFDFLLFLDCDSSLSENFSLKKYLNSKEESVVCGGRKYPNTCPKGKKLHYKYGIKREINTLSEREKKPFKSFYSSNFFIEKHLFLSILFKEELLLYGHEDTILSIELKRRKTNIKHIDNPVLHSQLENDSEFIVKQKQAIQNLLLLVKDYDELKTFSPLVNIANKLHYQRLSLFILPLSYLVLSIIHFLLKGIKHIPLLQLYKLVYLIHMQYKNINQQVR